MLQLWGTPVSLSICGEIQAVLRSCLDYKDVVKHLLLKHFPLPRVYCVFCPLGR